MYGCLLSLSWSVFIGFCCSRVRVGCRFVGIVVVRVVVVGRLAAIVGGAGDRRFRSVCLRGVRLGFVRRGGIGLW